MGTGDDSNDALLAAALREYAAGLPARVAVMGELVARGAWGEVRRAAHKLRGSAAVYGFAAISAPAAAIEDILLEAADAPDGDARSRIAERLVEAGAEALRAAPETP